MDERRLIGNILAEDGEAEEEHIKFILNKRRVLLNKDELSKIHRRRRSEPELVTSSWKDEEYDLFENQPSLPAAPPEPIRSYSCEYSGKIIEMSQEQNGSRLLQEKLEKYSQDEKQAVFAEVSQSFTLLVSDIFGNFVIQKLLEVGSKEQKRALAASCMGRVVELSTHIYACRVIQKVLECCEIDQKSMVVQEFNANLDVCIENEYANHVVQKVIETMNHTYFEFILEAVRSKVMHWAEHEFGCRVLQRIIERVPRQQNDQIFNQIIMNSVKLSKSNYGNYVVQIVFERGSEQDRNELVKSFAGKICELSKNKIASNVVEKCIRKGTQGQVDAICDELFSSKILPEVANDRFSNFVVQRALEVNKGPKQAALIQRVIDHTAQLKNYKYGKFVLNCVEKLRKNN
jgi:pumilio RNA-binding family